MKVWKLLVLVFVLIHFNAEALNDCDGCEITSPVGFNYLKEYKYANSQVREYSEYSYVFTKGTTYRITFCQGNGAKEPMIQMYNSARSKILEVKKLSEVGDTIEYKSSATGIYYIRIAGVDCCGGALLAFKRD